MNSPHTRVSACDEQPAARAGTAEPCDLVFSPRYPLCWENPRTLRWGFDRVVARVIDPSRYQLELLAQIDEATHRLRPSSGSGTAHYRAAHSARRQAALSSAATRTTSKGEQAAPLRLRERNRLLKLLEPVVQRVEIAQSAGQTECAEQEQASGWQHDVPAAPSTLKVLVVPAPRAPLQLVQALQAQPHLQLLQSTRPAQKEMPDLLVRIEYYLEGPEALWADSEIPEVVLRLGDEHCEVGPVLGLAGGPCHGCLALGIRLRDPGVLAVALQLAGHTPHMAGAAPWGLVAGYIDALAAGLVSGDASRHAWAQRNQLFVNEQPGKPWQCLTREVTPHPECACRFRQ